MLEKEKRVHLDWVDALRVIACLFLVMQHCSDPFYMTFNLEDGAFYAGSAMASLSRPCVPLFVMITGVLLLPKRDSLGAFYKKRIGRIALPLLFWSIALPWIDFAWIGNLWDSTSPAIDKTAYTLEATLQKCYTFLFNFNYSTTPLWYLYMLIGLYLIMPLLSGWLRSASKRELQIVIAVWILFSLVPYIRLAAPFMGYEGNYGNMGLWGECDWSNNGTAYYVTGFAGYLLLGYYLRTYPLQWSMKRILLVFVPLFIVGFAISFGGYVLLSNYFPAQYAYLEIVWWTCGINVFLQTISLFVIVQKWFSEHSLSPLIKRLAVLSFGIYLCHFAMVQITYDLSQRYLADTLPAIAVIVVNIVATVILSAVIVKLMFGLSVTKKLVA